MLISQAWAQSAGTTVAAGSSTLGVVIQMVAILLVFYLLLIRPQQKKMKQHENELKALKPGDEIITGGGLYAVVKKIEDNEVTAEIAKGVEVKIFLYTIREVLVSAAAVEKATAAKRKKSKN